jgi:hypothetical protein
MSQGSIRVWCSNRRSPCSGLVCLGAILFIAGCTGRGGPTAPTSVTATIQPGHLAHDEATGSAVSHGMTSDDKGYIDGSC